MNANVYWYSIFYKIIFSHLFSCIKKSKKKIKIILENGKNKIYEYFNIQTTYEIKNMLKATSIQCSYDPYLPNRLIDKKLSSFPCLQVIRYLLFFAKNKQNKKDITSLFLQEHHFIFPPYSIIMLAYFSPFIDS